jgi:CRP-like cAMP-binding protein
VREKKGQTWDSQIRDGERGQQVRLLFIVSTTDQLWAAAPIIIDSGDIQVRTALRSKINPASRKLFNPRTFLSTIGKGRNMVSFEKRDTIFAQGDSTDGLFFIQDGKVQLNVVSEAGKEATLGILSEGDFFGEGGLAGQVLRMSSAVAMTDCVLLHVGKKAMMLAMSREPKLSAMFVKYLLKRNIRYQDDLVDQLFNSSEKRLARVLLLMAHFDQEGVSEMSVPRLSQETLAEMVGTTRSRVSFFMNRFRKLGFINYDVGDHLRVHSSLLNVVLHDDGDLDLTAGTKSSTASIPKGSEPPPGHGGAPDKDRAKRPHLGGFV